MKICSGVVLHGVEEEVDRNQGRKYRQLVTILEEYRIRIRLE
jgi:hypothetical protein